MNDSVIYLKDRVDELEKRVEDLERAAPKADVVIKRTNNGFLLQVYEEKEVFEDTEVVDGEVQPSAVHVLRSLAFNYLDEFTGGRYSKKRVFIRVQENEDPRWEHLKELLKDEDLVSKVWDIMEKEDEI